MPATISRMATTFSALMRTFFQKAFHHRDTEITEVFLSVFSVLLTHKVFSSCKDFHAARGVSWRMVERRAERIEGPAFRADGVSWYRCVPWILVIRPCARSSRSMRVTEAERLRAS